MHVLEKLHTKPVTAMKFNIQYEIVVSVDKAGILEYWTGAKTDYKFPAKTVLFESKLDTGMKSFHRKYVFKKKIRVKTLFGL